MDYKARLDPNFRPSKPDSRDRIASIPVLPSLPTSVDLKPWADEVEDQGQLSSCTANAGCSLLEIAYLRAGQSKDFSRLFLYWYTRLLGGISGDSGAYPRDIGKALNKYGVCLEPTWDYVPSQVNVAPSTVAQTEAKQFVCGAYESIIGSSSSVIDQIRTSLAQGMPVLTSMAIHNSFFDIKGPWQSHGWNDKTSSTNPIVGYHEVLIIGYDDASGRFLAENSWGPHWADGGFFGIPYSMIGSTVDEWWILTKIGVNYVPVDESIPTPDPAPVPPTPKEEKDNKIWIIVAVAVAVLLLASAFS